MEEMSREMHRHILIEGVTPCVDSGRFAAKRVLGEMCEVGAHAQPHHGTVQVPADAVGAQPGQAYSVHDLLSGAAYTWSEHNYVRLDPKLEPAHVFRVEVIR